MCGLLTAPQPLEASVYWLLEALLFCLTQVHSFGSRTGDSLYRFSTCFCALVSHASWRLRCPQQSGCQQSGQESLHYSLPWPIYRLLHFPVFHDVRVSTLRWLYYIHLVFLALEYSPIPEPIRRGFCKCCYCCPATRAVIYSHYFPRPEEFVGAENWQQILFPFRCTWCVAPS
jgi:hypothetical protein